MDDYLCEVYPNPNMDNPEENSLSLCPNDDQYFNIEAVITNTHVFSIRQLRTHSDTYYHSFPNISKDNMNKETIECFLSCIETLPKDALKFVGANILECAHDMATSRTNKNRKVLSMIVDVVITTGNEDETDDEDDNDNDYDDGGFEEDEEEDCGLVPAAVSSIEGLETLSGEEEGFLKGKCAICFEDFHVGVRMPCLHMFHKDCITSWLQKANSCPLCRFQMPTDEEIK
ncbi:RING-H2 finger protein ATL32-like [Lotus japonicus]|uniref:RING-H2 finger protein ATL32-like n=1 Tax=Lotus japonicus TaxID=34305 RepID=UPI00258E49FD|nr:RING-H2 finger protein ATL32-like [Lotus japonicus]